MVDILQSLLSLLQPKMVSPLPDQSTYRAYWGPSPTPTETPQTQIARRIRSGQTMTPSQPNITPYPTPNLNPQQQQWGNQLIGAARQAGVNQPQLAQAVGYNESKLQPKTTPNINPSERSYGPAQINLLAHPEITQQQAENPEFAKQFIAKRLVAAQQLFPDSIEKQILYYNVPQNAYLDPNQLSSQAAWYLGNALQMMGKVPSSEYLPVLQKYGLFR